MKSAKILKVGEFVALNESKLQHLRVSSVVNENIAIAQTEPLYESANFQSAEQIEPAIIALPVGNTTIESLNNTITRFLKTQRLSDEVSFTIGNFFSGDYKSGKSVWNEKSLCVSLTGEISDRAGTVATAVGQRKTASNIGVDRSRNYGNNEGRYGGIETKAAKPNKTSYGITETEQKRRALVRLFCSVSYYLCRCSKAK